MKNIITATNYTSQLAEALRQQKQAEAMQEQANAPIEIQSYKGVQAPIPWTALLAKGLGVVGSKVKEGRALKRQGELEKFKTEETQRQIANLLAPVAVGEQPGFRPMSNGSQLASALASANAPANVAGMAPTAGAGGMPGAAPNADLAAALGGAGRLSAGGPPGVSMNGPAPGGMPMMPTQAMPPVRPAPMGAPLAPIQTAAPMAATTRSANSQEMTQRAADAMASPFDTVRALAGNTLERAQGLQDEERKLERQTALNEKFISSFAQTAPKDENDNLIADPNIFTALVKGGDQKGAIEYYVKAGGDYKTAQQKAKEFELTLDERRAQREETANQREQDRLARLEIAAQGSADRRAIAAQGSADRLATARMVQANRPGRLLVGKQADAISNAGTALDSSERLLAGYKPNYSHPMLGTLSPELIKRLPGNVEQKAWWQDYNSAIAEKRHSLFGTALTKTELPAWEKLIVTPTTDPKLAAANLKRQLAIEARAASKIANGTLAQGFGQDVVEAYLGRPVSDLAGVGQIQKQQAGYGDASPATSNKAPPPGMDPTAWAHMTPAERKKF